MPRPPRQHLPGGVYHVTLRGNHRQPIFAAGADRDVLDDIVGDVVGRAGADVHAYCWMGNHVHAVVQVGDVALGRVMQCVATRYARYFQKALGTTGHLFERRYHAVLVHGDSQLLAAVRYVHLNPVRAGLVEDPARYRWCGHRGYLGRGGPAWLRTDLVLGLLAPDSARARRAYARFVDEECRGAKPAANPVPGVDDARPHPRRDGPAASGAVALRTLDDIVRRVCAEEGVSDAALRSGSRDRRLAGIRARVTAEALACGAASLSDIARRFDRHIASVAKALERRGGLPLRR